MQKNADQEETMATETEARKESSATELKQEVVTEHRALKIRLKTGVMAGALIAVHL